MDHKALLEKYMRIVCWQEGTTFTALLSRADGLTREEILHLKVIGRRIQREYTRADD